MNDDACVRFLQWCLPELDKRWAGFRKVCRQVCKRIQRRMHTLELCSLDAYRAYLNTHPDEWDRLDAMCHITISRFYRDRGVFDALRDPLLPDVARRLRERGSSTLHAWSAGCASGEEPFTLRILWMHDISAHVPDVMLHITATEAQPHMLRRAQRGCYSRGTLKELPDDWVDTAFEIRVADDEPYCLRPAYRHGIDWKQQDIRETMPDGPFDLILCRNLVFTYFDNDLQRTCLTRMLDRLAPRGLLVLGKHESLPTDDGPIEAWDDHKRIYRHIS